MDKETSDLLKQSFTRIAELQEKVLNLETLIISLLLRAVEQTLPETHGKIRAYASAALPLILQDDTSSRDMIELLQKVVAEEKPTLERRLRLVPPHQSLTEPDA